MPTVDLVIPVYNEGESLSVLHAGLEGTTFPQEFSRRYIYVNDGSNDNTQHILEQLAANDGKITVIELSRNFGHQAALSAGLEASTGDVIVSLDGDGQHPASLIPEMLRLYVSGYDIVRAQRLDDPRSGNVLKRITSKWFYLLINAIGEVNLGDGGSDFRLLSRSALDAVLQLPEYHRFYRGITAWIGFSHIAVPYKPLARIGGRSKYSLKKMLRLAGDGLFSFSLGPLRIALVLGAFFIFLAMMEIGYVGWVLLAGHGERLVPGWTSLILILTVSGAINMVLVGILGIYVGMIFHEVKRRPVYVVKSKNSKVGGAPR
jgi:dolichol-phosphate mannosyltransferase